MRGTAAVAFRIPIPARRKIKEQLEALLLTRGPMSTNDVYAQFITDWARSADEVARERDGRTLFENEIR